MSSEQLNILKKILGKYQKDIGIVVWGVDETGTPRKVLVKNDGTVKVEGVTAIAGSVDISDRWARQLGQVDIARYLGSAIGLANPLHSQIVYGGAVVDPRNIRTLNASDIVTVDNLLNPHPVDVTDEWTRQLGQVDIARYLGSAVGLANPIHTQIVYGGTVIDPRNIRALAKTSDELYAVLKTDAGVAYDARDRNWTITETVAVSNPNLDVALSTRASESTVNSILSRLDITLSALRDAITAAAPNNKTLADLWERLDSVRTQLDVALSTRASEVTLSAVKTKTDNLDVLLSTRASELTLSSILSKLDITLSALRDALKGTGNKDFTTLEADVESILTQIDVALSTRASETTLASVKTLVDKLEDALASVGTDKFRTSVVDALPAGTNTIGNVGVTSFPLKGTPNRLYTTASGQVVAAPGAGYKLRVYGFYLANESDEIARLRYGGSTGTVFAVCPSKGVAAMNLMGINEAGGDNENIYLEKTGTGYTLAVVWTETVAA